MNPLDRHLDHLQRERNLKTIASLQNRIDALYDQTKTTTISNMFYAAAAVCIGFTQLIPWFWLCYIALIGLGVYYLFRSRKYAKIDRELSEQQLEQVLKDVERLKTVIADSRYGIYPPAPRKPNDDDH